MSVIAIAAVAAIIGAIVLLALWSCLFYKFYWKRRKKLQDKKKKKDAASRVENGGSTTVIPNVSGGVRGHSYSNNADKVFNANQAFNLAYEGSVDEEIPDDVRVAYGAPYGNGQVYREQNYSTDSGSGISDVMEFTYGQSSASGMSRFSGSDSEGNRSVRFAHDLPTLRGDEPPDDGRTKIPKTKMGYWIKAPATPRGKKPLPMRYVGNKNPVYNKRANAQDVIAVEVKVPQKIPGKKNKRNVQTLQPNDVVIAPLNEFDPRNKSSKLTMENNKAFPLLQDVQTAGRPNGGNKVVRQRSILKKPKLDNESASSLDSQSHSVSVSSQSGTSGTDNSETEIGIVPQTAQRRSKRRRPRSMRNAGNNAAPVYGQPPNTSVQPETYKSINNNVPPIAHSSPHGSPHRYRRKTPENSLDRISNDSAQQSFDSMQEQRVKMPYDYFPPKSPGNALADNSQDEPLPIANSKPKTRSKDFNNPYESAGSRKHNRSSSDQESNYFSGNSVLNQLNSTNGPAGPPSDIAVQSRQKRRRKRSTKRSGANKPQVQQNSTHNPNQNFDNMAFVDDDENADMYSRQSKRSAGSTKPGYAVAIQGYQGSETEL